MPKENFTTWLRSGAVTLPKLIVVLISIGTAATVFFNYLHTIERSILPVYLSGFQALVCLILFLLVPRPVAPAHILLLDLRDIIAPHNLIRKLQSGKGPYKLILTQLRQTRRQVEKHVDKVDRTFLSALVRDLNTIIVGDGRIYDPDIFSETKLSTETLEYLHQTDSSDPRANRMILDDLFAEELEHHPRNEETVDRACRNIRLWIQLMFLCWALYYGATALSEYNKKLEVTKTQTAATNSPVGTSTVDTKPRSQISAEDSTAKNRMFGFILNVLSALTAVFVFFLYVEMSELTLDDQTTRSWVQLQTNSRQQVRDAFNQKALFACVAILVICLNATSFIISHKIIQSSADTIIACGSGIVMALVVGRLDSKFLDPGTWVVAVLYLYAVIQPLAIYFDDADSRFYATTLALFLKAFLWLVFYWAFTDGRLWNYVVAIRKLLLGETHTSAEALGT